MKGDYSQEGKPLIDLATFQIRDRVCSGPEEAYNACKKLEQDNRERNLKNAAILKRFNDAPPYDEGKRQASGEAWRNNRSTGFLSSIIARAIAPYKGMLESAETLTSATLDAEDPKSQEASKAFQVEITKTIRRWKGWNNFKDLVCQENLLYGYAFAVYFDTAEWRPTFVEADSVLTPDGCGQTTDRIPRVCIKQNFLPVELTDKFDDPEASEAAGWDLKNLAQAINDAKSETITKDNEKRKEQDTIRESNANRSYIDGVKVIETYTYLVREAKGGISSYFLNARTGDPLLIEYNKYESMSEALSILTLQTGNGKLHGSKGAGRIIYNTSIAAENARNLIADNLYLSGLLVLTCEDKNISKPQITVTHPFCIIPKGFAVSKDGFKADADAFFALDRHLTSLAEAQIGVFMPGQILDQSGEKRTASEINYTASIESQIRDALLTRFWGQFADIISNIQRRICSPDHIEEAYQLVIQENNGFKLITEKIFNFVSKLMGAKSQIKQEKFIGDEEAIKCIRRMLKKGLSREQIFTLANTPAQEVEADNAQLKSQAIDAIVMRYTGNPSIDQTKLIKMDIASKLGYGASENLVNLDFDQTVQAEQTSKQLMELTSIAAGEEMPISPRDNDMIHLQVMLEKSKELMPILQNAQTATPELLESAKKFAGHFQTHLDAALAKGEDKANLKPFMEFASVANMLMQAADAMAAQAPQLPQGQVPVAPMTPNADMQSPSIPQMTGASPEQTIDLQSQQPAQNAIQKPLSK